MTSEFSEKETAQMRRAGEVKRIAASTLLRSAPLLAVVFAALWAAFAAALAARSERSPARYSAATKLIYAPRQNSKLPPLGDKQAFGVLDRASLKRSVADRADLSPAERGRLAGDIDFEQSPRPSNIFVVTARAPSASNAVAKANAFAAAVVDAYVEYRKHDIDAWASDLRRQKEEFEARLAEMDAAGAFPADPFSASVAAEAVSLFRGVASGHRRELGSLAAEIAGERAVVAELEKTLGTNGAAVVRNAPRLAAIGGEIAAIDADLTKLREKYTDRNPKVKGKLEDRAALAAEYGVLMAEAGLGSDGGGQFGLKADAARRLAGAVARLEALEARKAALEKEIADSDEKAVSAAGGAPGAERAAVRRNELERAVLGLEERLNDAMFFAATVSADLRQIEPAADVSERRPGGRRDIAAAGAAARSARPSSDCFSSRRRTSVRAAGWEAPPRLRRPSWRCRSAAARPTGGTRPRTTISRNSAPGTPSSPNRAGTRRPSASAGTFSKSWSSRTIRSTASAPATAYRYAYTAKTRWTSPRGSGRTGRSA